MNKSIRRASYEQMREAHAALEAYINNGATQFPANIDKIIAASIGCSPKASSFVFTVAKKLAYANQG